MVSVLDTSLGGLGSSPLQRTVLCAWTRHLTLIVPISNQVYIKWVQTNLMLGGNLAMDKHPIQGGVEILPVTSCLGNRDKLRADGPLSSYAYFTYSIFVLKLYV